MPKYCKSFMQLSGEPHPLSNRRFGHLGRPQKQLLARPNYNRTITAFFVPHSQETKEPATAVSFSVEERTQLEHQKPKRGAADVQTYPLVTEI